MNAQKYLEAHWKTGDIAHSQMITFMEDYADIKLTEYKAKNLSLRLAVEFGYKQCEKGNNIQMALIEFNKVIGNDR